MNTSVLQSERFRYGRRFDRWVLDRVRTRRGTTELPLKLEYRHIYVMPTIFGFWFGVLLALTAVGGLNFNNNMALLLGFLLASIAQTTTLLAYRNLVGMSITAIRAEPVFAGQKARFRILLKNPDNRSRFALQAVFDGSADCRDIGENETGQLQLAQHAEKRGWMRMKPFRLENRYPLGLFRAWSVIIPDARCLVYPMPNPHPPPLPRSGHGDHGTAHKGEGEHLHGLRKYQRGDSLRRVAWRTSARHEKLYTREMEAPAEEACEFNWYLMGPGDTETKLSILAAWILRAEHQQIPYSVELPADALPAGLGEEHSTACLRMLALFGQ